MTACSPLETQDIGAHSRNASCVASSHLPPSYQYDTLHDNRDLKTWPHERGPWRTMETRHYFRGTASPDNGGLTLACDTTVHSMVIVHTSVRVAKFHISIPRQLFLTPDDMPPRADPVRDIVTHPP